MIEIGSALDPGQMRTGSENQDALGIIRTEDLPDGRPAFMVIADGMGGYEGGATASRLVVQEMATVYKSAAWNGSPISALRAGVTAAHETLQKRAAENTNLFRMGSTVVAAVAKEDKVYLLNVGDSRAYLINQNEVRQISYDHSLVGEQLRRGLIGEDEVRTHPRRNVLSMAISVQRGSFEPFTGEFDWQPGDVLVLCSDGLWGPVPEDQIQAAVLDLQPRQAAKKLVDLANANQGPDNISVIVARLS